MIVYNIIDNIGNMSPFFYTKQFNVSPNAIFNGYTYSSITSSITSGSTTTFSINYNLDSVYYSATPSGNRYITVYSYTGSDPTLGYYLTYSNSYNSNNYLYNIDQNGNVSPSIGLQYTSNTLMGLYGNGTTSFVLTTTTSNIYNIFRKFGIM